MFITRTEILIFLQKQGEFEKNNREVRREGISHPRFDFQNPGALSRTILHGQRIPKASLQINYLLQFQHDKTRKEAYDRKAENHTSSSSQHSNETTVTCTFSYRPPHLKYIPAVPERGSAGGAVAPTLCRHRQAEHCLPPGSYRPAQ